jgi:hypothetical protein
MADTPLTSRPRVGKAPGGRLAKGTVPLPDEVESHPRAGKWSWGGGDGGDPFLQSLRPQDVAHQRQQLLRWWSHPGEWQHKFALHGRRNIPGWLEHPEREAEEVRWWMEDTFRKAELYWVSPEMTDVITTLAPGIPDTLPQPPVPHALVMFAKSIPGTDAEDGSNIYTSAFLWSDIDLYKIGPCIAMESYAWRDWVGLYRGLDDEGQQLFREIYPNRLMPTGGSEWPMGALTSEFDTAPAEDDLQRQSMVEDRRLLSTFWALASQKIVIESRHQPSRAERRAAQREGRPLDEVRVIRLREPATRSRGDAGSDVEWSHRWIVGKHWRNQWYPASGQHRPKLIEAYQKGPADKPLVLRETVRALVR